MFPGVESCAAAGVNLVAREVAGSAGTWASLGRRADPGFSRRGHSLATTFNTLELPPSLLVGSRTIAELEAAIRGGADLVEFKFKSCNSHPQSLNDLVELAGLRAPRLGICVDLGDVCDFRATAFRPGLPPGVRWARLGLAGCRDTTNWQADWQQIRSEINAASGRPLKWLAVAHADADFAGSPKVGEVVHLAVESQCSGLFLETHRKSACSIADTMTPCELTQTIWMARELRLPVFIGGTIGLGDLDWICDLEPAVVAVRSTVCDSDDVDQSVSETSVDRFKHALEAAAGFDRPRWDFLQQCRARQAASATRAPVRSAH